MSQNPPMEGSGFIRKPLELGYIPNHLGFKQKYPFDIEIDWSLPLGVYLLGKCQKIKYPYRESIVSIEEPYYSVLRGFFCALDAYEESSNPKLRTRDILERSLLEGPAYAKFLKNLRRKSIMDQMNAEIRLSDPELENITSVSFTDIGDIFNYLYLPNFKKEDPEDYLYGMIPTNISSKNLSIFKDTLSELIDSVIGKVEVIDPNEVLITLSGSKSFENDKKNSDHFSNISHPPKFSKKIRKMKRSLINAQPNTLRDSVILRPDDLNSVKFIDLQVRELLRHLKGHIHLDNAAEIESRIDKFYAKYKYFFMRDIQKEGITKPKELIKLILSVLKEKFQNDLFSPELFDNYELIVNKELTITPIRGHGLGMGNAITTLMQLTFFKITLSRLEEEGAGIDSYGLLCLNDDYVAGSTKRHGMEDFWDMETTVLEDYSILIESNKSFYCKKAFVIAEQYRPKNLSRKESYYRSAILRSLACINICHAKSLINGIVNEQNVEYYLPYEKEIITYWGYEFFPDEYLFPSACGGWYSSKIMGVSFDLFELDQLPYTKRVYNAYKACQETHIYKMPRKQKEFSPPILDLFPVSVNEIESKYHSILDIVNYSKAYQKYHRIVDKEVGVFWMKLCERRKEIYNLNIYLPFESFMKEYINDNPTKTYYPPEFMIDSYIQVDKMECKRIDDVYMSRSPIMSYLGFLHPEITNELPECFSINFIENDSVNTKLTNQQRAKLRSGIIPNTKDYFYHDVTGIPIFRSKEDEALFLNSYINPISIFYYLDRIAKGGWIPIIKEEYISPLIQNKMTVFGRLLTCNEQLFFSKMKFKRSKIKEWVEAMSLYSLSLEEMIEIVDDLATRIIEDEDKEITYVNNLPLKKFHNTKEFFSWLVENQYDTEIMNTISLEDTYNQFYNLFRELRIMSTASERIIFDDDPEELKNRDKAYIRRFVAENIKGQYSPVGEIFAFLVEEYFINLIDKGDDAPEINLEDFEGGLDLFGETYDDDPGPEEDMGLGFGFDDE